LPHHNFRKSRTVVDAPNNAPKSGTNAKYVNLAFYKVDLPSGYSATKLYNVTVFVGGINKAFASTADNTIIRCYAYSDFSEVVPA
jgi:hypothetical protein